MTQERATRKRAVRRLETTFVRRRPPRLSVSRSIRIFNLFRARGHRARGGRVDRGDRGPPGKDASDPNKTNARKALFQSTPKASDKTENTSTPSTGEKRNIRENNIVIPRGCDPSMKPEQVTSLLVKAIENEGALVERLKIKPLEMASAAMVKITSESLDDIQLAKHKQLFFMKEGLQNMVAMMVVPKSACVGIIAAQFAAYYTIYQRVQRTTQKEEWSTRAEWMKKISELFKAGTEAEFEMSYERSVDRHKDKMAYCADAMAIGLASWALPNVIVAFTTVLRGKPDCATEEGRHFEKFQSQLRAELAKFGVCGPEKDDGWVVYPVEDEMVLTAKGLDLLRVPVGTKVELKKLVCTGTLQSSVDIYVAPQSGVFNIKRGFRDGGEGCEAVITELGDEVQLVIPRIEPDTEATGLLKLTLRIKLTAEKEIEKKLLKLCKDPRNDAAEVKGIHTKLDSGAEVRMIWSGDLGTARARNGLNRVAAVSAEAHGKNSEEVKKLKGELEKQIKANADALLEQDTKLTAYTAHYTALLDKQATQTAEMQKAHGDALTEIHTQLKTQMEAHKAEMDGVKEVLHEERAAHKAEMDDVREVLKESQLRQLGFAAQAEKLTSSLAAFSKAMELQMLATREDVRLLKELKGDAGYVHAVASALAEQQAALRNKVAHFRLQVTAFATAVHTGRREDARGAEAASQLSAPADLSADSGRGNNQEAGSADTRADMLSVEKPQGDVAGRRAREALQRAWATWSGRRELGDRGARGRRRMAGPVAQRVEGADWGRPLQLRDVARVVGPQQSQAACEHIHMHSIRGEARNGHKGILCGAKGILCVDTFVSSKTYSSALEHAQADQVDSRTGRRDGQGDGKFGKLRNSASTSGVHAILPFILLAVMMDVVQASATQCCSTIELRRVDGEPMRCYDRATLRCYGGAALASAQDGAGGRWPRTAQGCGDAGEEFWQCASAAISAYVREPSPAPDATLAVQPEPEPSPRLADNRDCTQSRSRSEEKRREAETKGGGAIATRRGSWSKFARRSRQEEWRLVEPFTIQRGRRLRWYICRKAWKRLMRSLRGNTVNGAFTVALWNAREFHADADPTRGASRNKMKWLIQRLEAERPDACFVLEMMGGQEAFTAVPNGLRARARHAGYKYNF
jgi:hypothetical protein